MLLHSRGNLASPRRIGYTSLLTRDGAQRGHGLRQRLIIGSKDLIVRVLVRKGRGAACVDAGNRLTA
jgi:hypothetical protein